MDDKVITEEIVVEERTINFLGIIKEFFRRKLVLGLVLGISLLFGVLLFGVILRNNIQDYSMYFSLTFEGISEEEPTYTNGNAFTFEKIISRENISRAVEKIDTIYINQIDAISDSVNIREIKDYKNTKKFVFSISKNVIDKNNAESLFLELLALEEERIVANSLKINDSYYELFSNSISYENQIDILLNQISLMKTRYAYLIDKYGSVIHNGKNIIEYSNKVNEYYDSYALQGLYALIDEYGYVKNFDSQKTALKNQKKSLELEFEMNEAIITRMIDIKNSSSDYVGDEFMLELMNLVKRNEEIKILINKIDKKLGFTLTSYNVNDFEQLLNNEFENVKKLTTDFNAIYNSYSINQVTYSEVGTSGLLSIVIGIASCVIIASIGYLVYCTVKVGLFKKED